LCEYIVENSDWDDVETSLFEIFMFFYFVTGRIYEAEIISTYILQSNDPRLERLKINVF
jgi:hypothetical protein